MRYRVAGLVVLAYVLVGSVPIMPASMGHAARASAAASPHKLSPRVFAAYQKAMIVINRCLTVYPTIASTIQEAARHGHPYDSRPALAKWAHRVAIACGGVFQPNDEGGMAPDVVAWRPLVVTVDMWLAMSDGIVAKLWREVAGTTQGAVGPPYPLQQALKDLPFMERDYISMRRQLRAFRVSWGLEK